MLNKSKETETLSTLTKQEHLQQRKQIYEQNKLKSSQNKSNKSTELHTSNQVKSTQSNIINTI